MSDIVIKVDNIAKKYRLGEVGSKALLQNFKKSSHQSQDDFWALDNFSTEIHRGEAIGVIGKNGSGKSTFLKILARITAPTMGCVTMHGRVASMLEVGTGFHPEMTGRENIYLNGSILGMSSKEIELKVDEIISFSECAQFIDTPVKHYSSGMYVKLAFSVAAHLDSDILLLDEVLAVGDMNFQKKCLNKMKDIVESENRTVVFVSHNMDNIRELCTRCILLDKGKMLVDGSIDEAVAEYLGGSTDTVSEQEHPKYSTKYNLDAIARPLSITQFAHIRSFEFINRKFSIYKQGEKLDFSIDWVAKKEISDSMLKVVILRAIDRQPVGMVVSDVCLAAKEHETILSSFSLDVGILAQGDYLLNPVICWKGNEIFLTDYDLIPYWIPFKVILSDDFLLRHDWPYNAWGNEIFPGLKLLNQSVGEKKQSQTL